MIYTTCIMAFATFSYSKSTSTRTSIGLGIFSLAAWITGYYVTSKDPVFHQVAYAALTCAVVFRGMYVMSVHLQPALEKRTAEAKDIMNQMWKMAFTGMPFLELILFHWCASVPATDAIPDCP